jgi:hypothetical protein
MNKMLPTAMVNEYEHHIPALDLPDPNGRRVVAAGIAAGASVILTWNVRHFPIKALKKHGLRKETPDAFLSDLYDEIPALLIGSLANARRNLTKTQVSALNFIDILRNQRLVELANRVQKRVGDL